MSWGNDFRRFLVWAARKGFMAQSITADSRTSSMPRLFAQGDKGEPSYQVFAISRKAGVSNTTFLELFSVLSEYSLIVLIAAWASFWKTVQSMGMASHFSRGMPFVTAFSISALVKVIFVEGAFSFASIWMSSNCLYSSRYWGNVPSCFCHSLSFFNIFSI